MSQLNQGDIVTTIEQTYYKVTSKEYFHFSVDFIIKLSVVMHHRKIAYRHFQSEITEEVLSPHLPKNTTSYLPTPSTLHHFVKYRLGEEGGEAPMYFIGKRIALIFMIKKELSSIQRLFQQIDIV